jgi:anthranilate synthase component 1
VPSQRFRIDGPPPPLETYRRLRRLNPSPYGYLLEWGDFALVGASPEMLVRVQDGEAETLPIAGTMPRGASAEEDALRFEALKHDPKELAEHQMLVDLARNDLGRVAVPGGVRVELPLALQRTSHVLHLTTTVKAKLKPGVDALDVLAAAFPAGTVSGAPKLRACQRIAEMEGEQRGPYGGVLLRLGADGTLDTALILRTAVYVGGKAYIQAGAGVVLVDLAKTTHFEVENEVVWAHAGTRLRTTWTSLAEVENAFPGAGLLRIHRHLVVRPDAVIGLKPAAGGRAIVRLQGGAEIEASRGGAPRLRERLGL